MFVSLPRSPSLVRRLTVSLHLKWKVKDVSKSIVVIEKEKD